MAGTLEGKSLPVGGAWSGAGGTTVFTVDATNHWISRAGPIATPRIEVAGAATFTTALARVDFKTGSSTGGTALAQGVVLRYTDTSNYLVGRLRQGTTALRGLLEVRKVETGTPTTICSLPATFAINTWYTIVLHAYASGFVAVVLMPQGSKAASFVTIGRDTAVATGGALASGKVGIYDLNNVIGGFTDYYDNFAAWVPNPDAVTFASQSTQLTTDGHYRLDTGGTAYGPVSIQSGDLPRLPVAGLEGRTTEVFLKSSRGDFDSLPDSGIDDVSARVYYSPSWLVAPDQ